MNNQDILQQQIQRAEDIAFMQALDDLLRHPTIEKKIFSIKVEDND